MKRTRITIRFLLPALLCFLLHGRAKGRTLELFNAEGVPGATVTAALSLDDAAELAAMEFQLNYDRNLLTFISATNYPGTLGGEFDLDLDAGDGILVVRLYRDSQLSSGSGLLVAMTFGVNTGAEPGMSAPLVLAGTDFANQYGADLRWNADVSVSNAVFTAAAGPGSTSVLFTRLAGAGGRVAGSVSGPYPLNSVVAVTAVPAPYFFFAGWSGDTEGDTNRTGMTLILDRPQTVTARFMPYVTQNTGTPHWWLAQNGLTNLPFEVEALQDSDADGCLNWKEYVAGTSPTLAASLPPLLKWQGAKLLIETSVSGRRYFVDSRTNLFYGVWQEYTNQPGTGAELLFDVDGLVLPTLFFRYRIQLQD